MINTYVRQQGALLPYRELSSLDDDIYIYGAIEIKNDTGKFLGKEWITLVDQLWAYLIIGIEESFLGSQYQRSFPEEPIDMQFIPIKIRESLQIKIGDPISTRIYCNKDFIENYVLPHVKNFYQNLKKFNQEDAISYLKSLELACTRMEIEF